MECVVGFECHINSLDGTFQIQVLKVVVFNKALVLALLLFLFFDDNWYRLAGEIELGQLSLPGF